MVMVSLLTQSAECRSASWLVAAGTLWLAIQRWRRRWRSPTAFSDGSPRRTAAAQLKITVPKSPHGEAVRCWRRVGLRVYATTVGSSEVGCKNGSRHSTTHTAGKTLHAARPRSAGPINSKPCGETILAFRWTGCPGLTWPCTRVP